MSGTNEGACGAAREALPELARGGAPAPEVLAHLESCTSCKAAADGARGLGDALGRATPAAEPADDLVLRTLAKIAAARPEAAPAPAEPSPPPRAVTILATPLPGLSLASRRRGRGVARLFLQAAAAALLFLATGAAVATFYPGVLEALRDDHERKCAERLTRLGRALRRYRELHPEAPAESTEKRGRRLRDALVVAGLAKAEDFVCPGARASRVDADMGYVLRLPSGGDEREAVAWDHFDNHRPSVFVAYSDGEIAKLDELELSKSFFDIMRRRK